MGRRVFFSYHYDGDVWRAHQVRNWSVEQGWDVAGFFDRAEYEDAKARPDTVQRMIFRHLANTSVTAVLIGTKTAERPWVQKAIEWSLARKNAIVGVHIHSLKDQYGAAGARGKLPDVPPGVDFPIFEWNENLAEFAHAIESAGQRAENQRAATL
jgi:hypothetical protein